MENKYYNTVIGGLAPLFTEQGFKESPDAPGIYLNDKKAVKVEYVDSRKMFVLETADIVDGEGVDFNEVAGWFFDESHNEKDAAVIAEDFTNVIKDQLGIAPQKTSLKREVSLPTKNAAGQTPGVEALAKRFLDIFPQYKETYKENVGTYGEFMYDDFFSKTAAVKLRELTTKDGFNKKHITKLFTLLNDMYAEGDASVTNTIMFTILGGAFGGDIALFDSMKEYYESCPYIKQNGRIMISVIASNKKYQEALSR